MPGQMWTVKEKGMKEGSLLSYVGLAPGTETDMSSSVVKDNAYIKKGYIFSKV